MRQCSRIFRLSPVWLTALLLAGGCGEGDGMSPGAPPPGPAGAMPGPGGPASPGIKQIMVKLAKGRGSLTQVIGNELNQDPPPWETIQGQTTEYVQSATELGKYDPPKGSKESWTTLAKAFADMAIELDGAALAKNKEKAKVAHDQLANSCKSCHDAHRRMGRGPGGPPGFGPPSGPGGPPRGGSGGPPPGGPGGPPPGGPPQ